LSYISANAVMEDPSQLPPKQTNNNFPGVPTMPGMGQPNYQ